MSENRRTKEYTPSDSELKEASRDNPVTGVVSSGGAEETDDLAEQVLPVVVMPINLKDVKHYYAKQTPDVPPHLKDIIIYVRRQYPNPRQRVVLQSDVPLPVKDLSESLIYVAGVNDDESMQIRGVGQFSYCLVEITKEFVSQYDYNLKGYMEEFCRENNIDSCELLVYGDDVDLLIKVWQHVQDEGLQGFNPSFPAFAKEKLRLFANGLDLAPYAKKLAQAHGITNLKVPMIRSMLDEIGAQIKSGKVLLQDFEDTRSYYAKWLTLVLTQLYNLVPVYLGSYITEYTQLKVAYPLERLSMYERFKFVEALPQRVGYIGKFTGFRCYYEIINKIYPIPAIVFDLELGKVILEGLERFRYENLTIQDWRAYFPQSHSYFGKAEKTAASKSMALTTGKTDREVDDYFRDLFLQMIEASGQNIFISIRNAVPAIMDGRHYILYYSQPLGLVGVITSSHLGRSPLVIKEEDFYKLIDVRLIAALDYSVDAPTEGERKSQFTSLMERLPITFKPAIPLDVLMYCTLARPVGEDLSYYDRRLRCDKCVFPIITHEDSRDQREPSVFDKLDIVNVGRDKIAGPVLSSFGSINSESGYVSRIPVSIDSFKGWKLL